VLAFHAGKPTPHRDQKTSALRGDALAKTLEALGRVGAFICIEGLRERSQDAALPDASARVKIGAEDGHRLVLAEIDRENQTLRLQGS
jgi:hypothetical protein